MEFVELLGYIYIYSIRFGKFGAFISSDILLPLFSSGMPLVYIGMLYTGFSGSIHFYFIFFLSAQTGEFQLPYLQVY